jgi:hypothetical protein
MVLGIAERFAGLHGQIGSEQRSLRSTAHTDTRSLFPPLEPKFALRRNLKLEKL